MFMGRSLTAANHERGQLWSQTWMVHTTRVILRKPRCLRTTKFFFLKNCEESNHLPEAGSDSKCRTLKIFGPAKY